MIRAGLTLIKIINRLYWQVTTLERELKQTNRPLLRARRFGVDGEGGEAEGEQGVAGEDRRRLVVAAVGRRASPSQVVVVQGREVVVDQAVGVDHLERRAAGQQRLPPRAEALAGEQHQSRPDALAAREDAVAHRLVQPRECL